MAARTYAYLQFVLKTLTFWAARKRQRAQLLDLAEGNPHLLRDIGVSKAEALAEARTPFWAPPSLPDRRRWETRGGATPFQCAALHDGATASTRGLEPLS